MKKIIVAACLFCFYPASPQVIDLSNFGPEQYVREFHFIDSVKIRQQQLRSTLVCSRFEIIYHLTCRPHDVYFHKIGIYANELKKSFIQAVETDTLPPKPVSTPLSKSKPQAKLSHVLPNGNKVYILPQDNMPCIVPNTAYYNYNMPVYKGKTMGGIPNISPREQIIPDTLSREKNYPGTKKN